MQKMAQDELYRGPLKPVWITYTSNYSLLLIYYLSHISEMPYITLCRHITQVKHGGFTPCLASLKAYA